MFAAVRPVLVLAALAPILTACAVDGTASTSASTSADAGKDRMAVLVSFYPLEYAAARVGGDLVTVANLTRPGTEPHDLELTPRDVGRVADADLVVYLGGFQPAVDDAVAAEAAGSAYDAGRDADLSLTSTPIEEGQLAEHEKGTDPHFWLDPTRLAAVGTALGERLAAVRPEHEATFAANAAALAGDLAALDAQLTAGLATCPNRTIVTSHNAFGYLADRYDLTQQGIAGLTPENEPSAADLAAVTELVRANGVRTIYYETLVNPAVARTVAAETGAQTSVLDPIEGLSDQSQGDDYLEIMRANLTSLQKGQPCL